MRQKLNRNRDQRRVVRFKCNEHFRPLDYVTVVKILSVQSRRVSLWRGNRCRQVKIRVNVRTVRRDKKKLAAVDIKMYGGALASTEPNEQLFLGAVSMNFSFMSLFGEL